MKKDGMSERAIALMLGLAKALERWTQEIPKYEVEWLDTGEDSPADDRWVGMVSLASDLAEILDWGQLSDTLWNGGAVDAIAWWLGWNKSLEYAEAFRQHFEDLQLKANATGEAMVTFGAKPGEPPDLDIGEVSGRILYGDLQKGVMRSAAFLRLLAEQVGGPPTIQVENEAILMSANDSPAIPRPDDTVGARGRRGMRRDEANVRAREAVLRLQRELGRLPTAKELAKNIGCAQGLLPKLPAWQVVMEAKRRMSRGTKARTVSLTSKLEAVASSDADPLESLVEEQRRDAESDRRAGSPRRANLHLG